MKTKHYICVNSISLLVLLIYCTMGQNALYAAQADATETVEPAEATAEMEAQESEAAFESAGPGTLGFFDMSLEQLMQVEISTASLTKTTVRNTPSAMTTITHEDIRRSGARSLVELLEIYVPNFQWVYHLKPRRMGLRGMIGTDDKYLLLVNGRQMNEKTDFGVFSERDLPMLGDIERIDVIRGPGSALYGPGALSMVINLITYTPRTFNGMEVNVRAGIIEEHYTTEFKWGKMFSENQGLLIYGGSSYYPGASPSDAPLRYYSDGATKAGEQQYVNDYYSGSRMHPYNAQYPGIPRSKIHFHYTAGDLDIWARYTQGGEGVDQVESAVRDVLYAVGYRQGTIAADYTQEINADFSIKYHISYDRTQIETTPFEQARALLYREDKYRASIIANWDIHENHKVAFGGEYSHERFGLEPDCWGTTRNYNFQRAGFDYTDPMPQWHTDRYSALGEYQWTISEVLTAFVSGRLDKHPYVDDIFSPRGALVFTPNDQDTYKLMASRSSRTGRAQDMRMDHILNNPDDNVETLDSLEFRFERQHSQHLWFAAGIFRNNVDLVTYSPQIGGTGPVGKMITYGLEFEAKYKTERVEAIASHGFSKLDRVDLKSGILSIEETASPQGFGNDLANWSNHQSKLHVNYKLEEKWLLTSSIIVNWGYPGAQDYAEMWNASDPVRYDLDGKEAFGANYFWNMGLEHRYSENLNIRFDAYNILGWFDKDLAQRRFGFSNELPATVRIQPPAFGVQLTYTF